MKRCARENPSTALNTLNSKISPLTSTISRFSFQSNCIWRPAGVSKRGCASGSDADAHSMPRSRQYFVNAPYFGRSASGYLSSRNSWMAFFVTPGSAALRSMTSLSSSNELPLSRLRSSISSPRFQYFATVCLCSPYFLPICVKFGLMPSCLYMFNSPMTFLSNRAPSNGLLQLEASVFPVARLAKVR